MKRFITKMVLVGSVAAAPLLATGAAYAQRYPDAPWAYDAADHSRVNDQRGAAARDQQAIDEITRNDWNAGK
jgi:hypothetical protein